MNVSASALVRGSAQSAAPTLVERLSHELGGAAPAFVAAFCSPQQPLESVLQRLSSAFPGATVIGTTSAGEFTEAEHADGSIAALALSGQFRVFSGMGAGLRSDLLAAVRGALHGCPNTLAGYPFRTALVFVDPLSGKAEEVTVALRSLLGPGVAIVGGAAGDDLNLAAAHVGLNTRVASDAVAVAMVFSTSPLGVGVCHGHSACGPPLTVTKAVENVVYEIDGRPAWRVWAEMTREAAARHGQDPERLKPHEVGQYLLTHEAAIETGERPMRLRAPLSRTASGHLVFVCAVPEGSTIRTTDSTPERQIASAREAARLARTALDRRDVAGALVFDCVCRRLILDDEFPSALRGISEALGPAPLAGFATYGEIALAPGESLGFHNTTTVVVAFPT